MTNPNNSCEGDYRSFVLQPINFVSKEQRNKTEAPDSNGGCNQLVIMCKTLKKKDGAFRNIGIEVIFL